MIEASEIRIGNRYHRKNGKGWTEIEITKEVLYWMFSDKHSYAVDGFKPITLNEEVLKSIGYQYYNSQTSGDMTIDLHGKMDLDWIDGRIQIKSHYEHDNFYRDTHIKYLHQLQNAISAFNDIIK
jgi:hypothetical protein